MIDRLAAPLLLVGCAVFGLILLAEIEAPERIAVAASVSLEQAEPAPALPRLTTAPAAPPVAAILARPLFSPSRRPAKTETAKVADDGGLADSRLAGIVIEDGHRFAVFAPEGAKALTVTEGETVSGWQVESITPHEVSLNGPGGTKTLEPKLDPNLVRAAGPAPAANPGAGPTAPTANVPPRPGVRPGVPTANVPNPAILRRQVPPTRMSQH